MVVVQTAATIVNPEEDILTEVGLREDEPAATDEQIRAAAAIVRDWVQSDTSHCTPAEAFNVVKRMIERCRSSRRNHYQSWGVRRRERNTYWIVRRIFPPIGEETEPNVAALAIMELALRPELGERRIIHTDIGTRCQMEILVVHDDTD